MLLLMIERDMPIDMVLSADTSMEFPEMYEHLVKLDEHLFRERGIHITTLRHPKGFPFQYGQFCCLPYCQISFQILIPIHCFFTVSHGGSISTAFGRPLRKYLIISTLASIVGALSHMGLIGFGALWLLAAAGMCSGTALFAALTVTCGVLIAVCRYLEGVFSHQGAYGILAKMRVHLFDAIDRVAPAYLIGRETGDVMNIAVSDIETLEFFFAHTIGPMFTVILLPVTTVVLAWCVSPLYAWVLIPIYILISGVLPFIALKAGRGIGMRYREALGVLKSKILESVYSIRDIQIFGAGSA